MKSSKAMILAVMIHFIYHFFHGSNLLRVPVKLGSTLIEQVAYNVTQTYFYGISHSLRFMHLSFAVTE